MTPKPMVLVTIYPDGWVETRSTDDVRVKIHNVLPLRGNGSEVDAEHGISYAALRAAYDGLPWDWQNLVDETDARGIHSGLPNSCPEEDRMNQATVWAFVEALAEKVRADDSLRLDLYKIKIPQWIKDHAEKVRLAKVGRRWREIYSDQREGV